MRRSTRRAWERCLLAAMLVVIGVGSAAYLTRKAYWETHPYVWKPKPEPTGRTLPGLR